MKRIILTLLLFGNSVRSQDIPEPESDFSLANYVPKDYIPGSDAAPCHDSSCNLSHGSPHMLQGDRGHRNNERTFAIITALTSALGAIITFLMYLDRDHSSRDDDE